MPKVRAKETLWYIQTVDIFSGDIVGNLEKRSGERGKVITTDGVRLPDRQHMKDIEETGYTYLRILESDTIKEKK